MSHSTLYALHWNGSLEDIGEFRNSHLSAPPLWDMLVKRFYPHAEYYAATDPVTGEMYVDKLFSRMDEIPSPFKEALAFTADYCLLPIDDTLDFADLFIEAGNALDELRRAEPDRFAYLRKPDDPPYRPLDSHWVAFGEAIKKFVNECSDLPNYRGILLNGTSVCDVYYDVADGELFPLYSVHDVLKGGELHDIQDYATVQAKLCLADYDAILNNTENSEKYRRVIRLYFTTGDEAASGPGWDRPGHSFPKHPTAAGDTVVYCADILDPSAFLFPSDNTMSVNDINAGRYPWLRSVTEPDIRKGLFAGVSYADCREWVESYDGKITELQWFAEITPEVSYPKPLRRSVER